MDAANFFLLLFRENVRRRRHHQLNARVDVRLRRRRQQLAVRGGLNTGPQGLNRQLQVQKESGKNCFGLNFEAKKQTVKVK